MDPLRLPRARPLLKTTHAALTPAAVQQTRLPRLSDVSKGRADVDDGLSAPFPSGKQAPGRIGRWSNNSYRLGAQSAHDNLAAAPATKQKAAKKASTTVSKRSTSQVDTVGRLSALDERVLILYHSSLKYNRRVDQQEREAPALREAQASRRTDGSEAMYAAITIQKVARGRLARLHLAAFHGPRNQLAASTIQFAFRRALLRRRVAHRVWKKRQRAAVRVQAWYRGSRGRDLALAEMVRRLNSRIANFQRRFRGLRFWRVVAALLHKRKRDAAIEVQRVFRGWGGRRRATTLRYEKIRFAQDLQSNAEIHARLARCEGCNQERCTEQSLLRCVMARYLGLHDLVGARALGDQGLQHFPSSPLVRFIYACLLQSACEDLEVSMAHLSHASGEGVQQHELDQYEEQYYQAALMLRPNDAALHLHMAIFFQSSDRNDRAEAHYKKALAGQPGTYPVPGYLERVRTVDRVLLNYHRFCAVFNFRQVNVLVKDIGIAKRGPKIRLRVAKMNHFTVIGPLEQQDASRMNSVYLTDEEMSMLLGDANLLKAESSSQLGPNDSRRHLKLAEWRNNNARASLRRTNAQQTVANRTRQADAAKWRPTITQLYQDEFLGLYMKPADLAKYSLLRSRLRLTKENAEALLKLLMFIDPSGEASQQRPEEQLLCREVGHHLGNLRHIMLIPRILRLRFDRRVAFLQTHASIEIQSTFRGYRFRAEVRRVRVLHEIHRRQVDEVFARLSANLSHREMRRKSAVEIQRIVRGVQQRGCLRNWRVQAVQIQRIFRGYLGRKRAIAFREGSCTFYMVERVFQRGIEVSGRFLMLNIDKCGMSFRMDGYDVEACSSYHGLFSHQSALGLLCYLNWTHAESFCGQELFLLGNRVVITSVASIDPATGECFVNVAPLVPLAGSKPVASGPDPPSGQRSVPVVDCINSINLRRMGTIGNNSTETVLPLPIKLGDTRQLVDAIIRRLVLTPALPMATHELGRRNASGLTITVAAPPVMHYVIRQQQQAVVGQGQVRQPRATLKKKKSAMKGSTAPESSLLPSKPALLPPATTFPVVNCLRGGIIGKQFFRKKCSRHAVTHTRCRCVLPLVSTPAYIETLTLALGPSPPRSYEEQL